MNTSAMNDKWRDKSAGTVPQKTKVIQYRSKEKEITMLLGLIRATKLAQKFVKLQPINVSILQILQTAGSSIINGIREEPSSGKNGIFKVCNFPGATREDM